MLNVQCWLLVLLILGLPAWGATNDLVVSDPSGTAFMTAANARELYNAGTQKLRAGKLDEAETLLEASLARQDTPVQPVTLFNLGYVRFEQGKAELKKSPDVRAASRFSRAADQAGAEAIQNAEDALAGNDIQQMVQAYLAGHGTRREMRAALKAVQSAMEAYGKTLTKWQRALNDFRSAAEMNPADTNAVRNAKIAEEGIARLIDSLRQMQQAAASLGQKQQQLGELLKKLRGRIPAEDMPPGAPGPGDEDEDGENGILPEGLIGQKESTTGGGREMELNISPEAAAQLLNGIQPDGKLLPVGEGAEGKPRARSGRNW